MFSSDVMQMRLLPHSDLPPLREALRRAQGFREPAPAAPRMDPLSQLIKAYVSIRTYDEISAAAFFRLRRTFPDWRALGEAEPETIEPIIDPVAFADLKAQRLPALIRRIAATLPDLDLEFLGHEPIEEAMGWLVSLDGVGVKCAASALNFSRLNRPAMVVDTHVHRIARRMGLISPTADDTAAYHALMAQAPRDWTAEDFFELHWLLKPHGQSICTHFDPVCGLCALRDTCPRVGLPPDPEAGGGWIS